MFNDYNDVIKQYFAFDLVASPAQHPTLNFIQNKILPAFTEVNKTISPLITASHIQINPNSATLKFSTRITSDNSLTISLRKINANYGYQDDIVEENSQEDEDDNVTLNNDEVVNESSESDRLVVFTASTCEINHYHTEHYLSDIIEEYSLEEFIRINIGLMLESRSELINNLLNW